MAVYTHLDADYAAVHIGSGIRAARKRCGFTLQELAAHVSVSTATLSGIENQKATADVGLLVALTKALNISVQELLPRSASCHFQITRRAQVESGPPLPMKLVSLGGRSARSYHNRLWLLADAFVDRYLEPLAIEIEPITDEELCFISHNHEEFFLVLRGAVECLVKSPDGLAKERLRVGDCMYFWSYLPHCIRSLGPEPALAVHVLCSLNEPADSESGDGAASPMVYLLEAPRRGIVEHVSERIVRLRMARGMSPAEFARQVGISVRRLARIERGDRPIPVDVLLDVCRRFRKPIEYFLATGLVDRPFTSVLRAAHVRRTSRAQARHAGLTCIAEGRYRSLADGFPKRAMHPYFVRLGPRESNSPHLSQHPGQEFVYVLRGAVALVTTRDGEMFSETLYPGDSCLIDAATAHAFGAAQANPYEQPGAEMLRVAWSPATETVPAH